MAPPVVAPPAPEAAAEREERSQAFNDPVDKRILGAAHSSAANAFAAAAVSTKPIPNRPAFTPRGQLLPDQRSLVCDVMGGVCPAEEQLEVEPAVSLPSLPPASFASISSKRPMSAGHFRSRPSQCTKQSTTRSAAGRWQ